MGYPTSILSTVTCSCSLYIKRSLLSLLVLIAVYQPVSVNDCSSTYTGRQEDRKVTFPQNVGELWIQKSFIKYLPLFVLSITSYQTLPRNMPSHRVSYMPHYGDGYRSMPRNSMAQRDSICSMSPSLYDQLLGSSAPDKRRSMRDDTMWQLYEWQQRQAYTRQPGLYNNMSSPKTMINLSEHAAPNRSIPPSPSHGSLSMYNTYSPMRSYNMNDVSSPNYRRDLSLDRRQRPMNKVS